MANEEGTSAGPKAHKREISAFRGRPLLEMEKACEGDQRAKAGGDTKVEPEVRNASSHSDVMACYRQDLPSVETQLSVAKKRKNEAEHHRAQQVSASVWAKHYKAEERHRQHIAEGKKSTEREVAKEESRRDAVLERKRRQEEETKQRRLAEFQKSEKQRLEALERCSRQKKSSKPSMAKTPPQSSPTRPHLSVPTLTASSPHPPVRMHKASDSHEPRSGQRGVSVYNRLYHNKSTGSLTTIVEELAPPMKSVQEAKVEASTMTEAATRGRKKKKSSVKDSPSLSVYPSQQMSDKQKTQYAAASSLKASVPTEPTVTCSSSKPAKMAPAHSPKKKQKTETKAASATATAREKANLHQYLSPTDPRVYLPSRGAKAEKEQKNGKKVQASSPKISDNSKSSSISTLPLAKALRVPKESADQLPPGIRLERNPSTPAGSSSMLPPPPVLFLDTKEDAPKEQLVYSAAEKSPRNSNDSGFGQRNSCEESRQSTHSHPTCDPGSDYESDDGQPQEKHSTKRTAAPLPLVRSNTCIPEIPSVVIQPVEDSDVISKPARGLKHTLSDSRLMSDDDQPTALNVGPRRHSDTPRRKEGIADMAPPNICILERHGSLPPSLPSNFQASFLRLHQSATEDNLSNSDDSHEESQMDSEQDDGGNLHSASKPTKAEDREARRSLVDQIMKETRAEKKELEQKPFRMDHIVPHALLRAPSSPVIFHPPSEVGSDGEEKEEKDSERERNISAPALMMKRESVQFELPIPYSGPVERLPSFASDEALNTEERNLSEKGIYFSMWSPAYHPPQHLHHPPFPGTKLTPLQESNPVGGTICDCVSSEDDDDDSSGSPKRDRICGPMMDEVISDNDDDEDQMDGKEFHKLFKVPADDVIESDSEGERCNGGVLPCSVGVPLMQEGQWVDEAESSSDETVDIVTSESEHKLEGRTPLSPPQANQLQGKVESSSCKGVDAVSSESESESDSEGVENKLGGGAVRVDDVSRKNDSEGQYQNGGATHNKDGSVSPHACKMRSIVKKDSMLLYSKLPPTTQKSFQSWPLDDQLVESSSDEEEESKQVGDRESSIQRTAIPIPPPPLKGILKNRSHAVHMSHSMKNSVKSSNENLEQHLTGSPGVDVQFHSVPPMAQCCRRLDEVCEEDSEGNEDTALGSVDDGHSSADSKPIPDDCISDSETEAMPDGSATGSLKHLPSHPGSHTEIQSKLEGYGNGFQSLTSKSQFADEIDSSSSDSDLDTEPLSVYGV